MSSRFPRPADPSIPFPAVHKEGYEQWRPVKRAGELAGWSVTLVAMVALTVLTALDTDTYAIRVYQPAWHFPLWIVGVLLALIALAFLVEALRPRAPWFQEYSFVEAIE